MWVRAVPTGKVKFYDAERQFGFISGDDGVADGRRGPQAISVKILEQPSLLRAQRRKPQDMVPVIEDLIKLLDGSSDSLRRGRYPANSHQIAKVLQVVAEDFDA